mmetsp:Transcript_46724/g.84333  ORF Transcript_46724/g.84333 Transcript_46724/m.84333 type:complete len:342 (-) Transcript_46724:114-1139(-)
MPVLLRVQDNFSTLQLQVEVTDSVKHVKEAIHKKYGIPAAQQRLYFAEQQLGDLAGLASCGIGAGCVLQLSRRVTCSLQDGQLDMAKAKTVMAHINSLAGDCLLKLEVSGTSNIASIKTEIQKRLGHDRLAQCLVGKDSKPLQDQELAIDLVSVDLDAVELQLVLVDPEAERMAADVASGRRSLQDLPLHLREDPRLLLAAICRDPRNFAVVPEDLRCDRSFLVQGLRGSPGIFHELPAALQTDPEIMLASLSKTSYHNLRLCSKSLRADRDFMLRAVSAAGSSLLYASENLKNDRALVLAAIANEASALPHASRLLQMDPAIRRLTAKNNSSVLRKLIEC